MRESHPAHRALLLVLAVLAAGLVQLLIRGSRGERSGAEGVAATVDSAEDSTRGELAAPVAAAVGIASREELRGPEATEKLLLNLFVDELLIESRVRERAEGRIEWTLGPEAWPPANGRLKVTVVDAESGAPLTDVALRHDWWGVRQERPEPGVTVFDSVPPGSAELVVGGGVYERVRRPIWIRPGEAAEVEIRLHPGVTIEGTVIGPDGRPAPATLIAWRIDPESGAADNRSGRFAKAGRDGHFQFTSMRTGRYLIRSIDADEPFRDGDSRVRPDASSFVEVEVTGNTKGMRIELLPVATLVLARSPLETETLTWHIEDSAGHWIRQGRLTDSAPFPVSLPAGSYLLVVEGGAGGTRSWPLELFTGSQRIDLYRLGDSVVVRPASTATSRAGKRTVSIGSPSSISGSPLQRTTAR